MPLRRLWQYEVCSRPLVSTVPPEYWPECHPPAELFSYLGRSSLPPCLIHTALCRNLVQFQERACEIEITNRGVQGVQPGFVPLVPQCLCQGMKRLCGVSIAGFEQNPQPLDRRRSRIGIEPGAAR